MNAKSETTFETHKSHEALHQLNVQINAVLIRKLDQLGIKQKDLRAGDLNMIEIEGELHKDFYYQKRLLLMLRTEKKTDGSRRFHLIYSKKPEPLSLIEAEVANLDLLTDAQEVIGRDRKEVNNARTGEDSEDHNEDSSQPAGVRQGLELVKGQGPGDRGEGLTASGWTGSRKHAGWKTLH